MRANWILPLLLLATVVMAQPHPKVGLVLSGGGAKGFAHIGVLRLLDSLNFPVDYIAGTSMGGIVGGFYAIGYNGEEIEAIVRQTDWLQMLNDRPARTAIPILEKQFDRNYLLNLEIKDFGLNLRTGLITGQSIMKNLSKYSNPASSIDNFDDFPIPFRCVAVDIISGQEVAIDSGYLALAMRATMAIPSIFTPVEYGDYLFVDGGVSNNLPVDVAKDMGAEFIIAVNVGAPPLKKEEIDDIFDVTLQTIFIPGFKREEANMQLADIVVTPDIMNYTTGDFAPGDVDGIIRGGHLAAAAIRDTLIALMEQWQLPVAAGGQRFANTPVGADASDENLVVEQFKVLRNNALSAEEICALVEVDSGAYISDINWQRQQELLDASGHFIYAEIGYQAISDSQATVFISVREKMDPFIHRVEIHGNESLSFSFLYNLLNVKPGKRFDPDYVNARLDELYSLGYFRLAYYTLEPYANGRVVFHLWIEESGQGKLRLGMQYVEEYNFVASVGLTVQSIIIDGMRVQYDLQFAGFTRFQLHMALPSLQLDNFVYPFARIAYENIEEDHYDQRGDIVARYNVDEAVFAAGLGLLFDRSSYLEVEMGHNYARYAGTIASDFAADTSNTVIRARYHADYLDDSLIPNQGLLISGDYYAHFYPSWRGGFALQRGQVDASYYWPVHRFWNLRLSASYADALGKNIAPVWYFKDRNPYNFTGMPFHQLRYTRLGTSSLKLRYNSGMGFYISGLASFGFGIHNPFFAEQGDETGQHPFWSAGVDISYSSLIGAISLSAGTRERNPFVPEGQELWASFSIGLPM
jgi:predicted acylesterase/phospholipase RssA